MSYKGPEGEGSFRVTLRLAAADRYQVQAVDPVGRALWSLDVADGRGLSLSHRSRTYCEVEDRFDLSGVALGPFPLLSLPSLLLGRVPAEPAEPVRTAGRDISFRDATGRTWSAVVDPQGWVESWTLEEEGDRVAWWVRHESWAILSDRLRGRQVRWREVLREELKEAPPPLAPPPSFREECRDPDVEDLREPPA